MLSLLKQYSSDNIVQATQITKDLHRSYIVMNYIEGGNLASALSQHGSIAEEDVQSFARSLIESIGELHSLGIGHFNLQPENILLRRGYQVSLCDLGNAAFLEDKISGRRHGNLAYAAPEDILKKPCASSDMWSIGVILFYCFCGHLPFDDSSNKGLKQKIFGHKYDFSAREWAYVSRGAKQFLSSLLHPDPHIRVTATEALNHPWLSSTEQRLPAKRQRRVRLWERLKRRQQKVPYDPRASTLSYSNNPFETFAA
jgi:serine/threonine protein kinase